MIWRVLQLATFAVLMFGAVPIAPDLPTLAIMAAFALLGSWIVMDIGRTIAAGMHNPAPLRPEAPIAPLRVSGPQWPWFLLQIAVALAVFASEALWRWNATGNPHVLTVTTLAAAILATMLASALLRIRTWLLRLVQPRPDPKGQEPGRLRTNGHFRELRQEPPRLRIGEN